MKLRYLSVSSKVLPWVIEQVVVGDLADLDLTHFGGLLIELLRVSKL